MMVKRRLLEDILQHFASEKKLQTSGDKLRNVLDRHRAFFVWRRTMTLGEKNPAWILEANHTCLKNRINSEFEEIEAFIDAKLGTPAYPGLFLAETGDASANHLDLKDLARRKTTEGEKVVRTRASRWKRLRFRRCQWIIWRAAALCDDVWNPSPDEKTATLHEDVIREYLDRRLRVVERMHFNIGGMGKRGWPEVTGVQGPWKDGFRVRIFEYPRINLMKQRPLRNQLLGEFLQPGKYVAEPLTTGLLPPEHDELWYVDQPGTDHRWVWTYKTSDDWGRVTGKISWRVAPSDGAGYPWRLPQRFPPPSIREDWQANGAGRDSYRIDLTPKSGRTGAQAIDDLFAYQTEDRVDIKEDIWDRAWLICDHVVAACNIEGLLFALRRRSASGEATFNKLVTGEDLPPDHIEPYVALTSVVGQVNERILMSHEHDRHFENRMIPDSDLQIGDHVVFWNHLLYQAFFRGPWRLENAYIMRVDSDGLGGINRNSIKLQGHGIGIVSYPQYQKNCLVGLRNRLKNLRKMIRVRVSQNPNIDHIPLAHSTLRKWSPYGDFQIVRFGKNDEPSLGAWWVEIPLAPIEGHHTTEEWRQLRRAYVQRHPKTVAHGVGDLESVAAMYEDAYNPPPNRVSAVYFPIFEPRLWFTRVPGRDLSGWEAFFEKILYDQIDKLPKLMPVACDATLIPGFYKGGKHELPVVRPLATPAAPEVEPHG